MAKLSDLENLKEETPRDFWEWLGRFSEEDQDLVAHSIITARADDVYAVISKLQKNPYPFMRETYNGHRRKLIDGR